jgi:hypothetical protein
VCVLFRFTTRENICVFKSAPRKLLFLTIFFFFRDGHVESYFSPSFCSFLLRCCFMCVNFFFRVPPVPGCVSSPGAKHRLTSRTSFSFSISARREERKRDPIERESEALVVSSSRRIEIVSEEKRDETKKRREAPLSLSLSLCLDRLFSHLTAAGSVREKRTFFLLL